MSLQNRVYINHMEYDDSLCSKANTFNDLKYIFNEYYNILSDLNCEIKYNQSINIIPFCNEKEKFKYIKFIGYHLNTPSIQYNIIKLLKQTMKINIKWDSEFVTKTTLVPHEYNYGHTVFTNNNNKSEYDILYTMSSDPEKFYKYISNYFKNINKTIVIGSH